MIFYEWHVLGRNAKGRDTKRKLRWRMTEAQAVESQAHSDNAGQVLEKVANSGEDRGEGGYTGWGQALQDESIEATKPKRAV